MKENGKALMTSVFLSNFADIATTSYGVFYGGMQEVGIAGSRFTEAGRLSDAFILRTAVTAGMIGLYALAKKHGGRWELPFDALMHATNIIWWSVVVANTLQMVIK